MYYRLLSLTICFLFFIATLSANAPSLSNITTKMIIRGSDSFEPFEYLDESGKPNGFNVDIIRALMKELGWEYDLKLGEFGKADQDFKDGLVDIMPGMIYSTNYSEYALLSLPTNSTTLNVYSLEGYYNFNVEQIYGKKIIVQEGGLSHNYIVDNNITDQLILTQSMDESFEALRTKKGDCVIASNLAAFYSMHKGGLNGIKVYDLDLPIQTYAIAVAKQHIELLYHINIGLQNLKASGEYQRIYYKWFGAYEVENPIRIEYYIVGFILVIVILILLIVARKIKKKAKKTSLILSDTKNELELSFQAGKITAWMYDIENKTIHSASQINLFKSGDPIENFYAGMIHKTADSFKKTQVSHPFKKRI
ncbi:MAG: transporter substrate-binding domain-containing protein [Phocaeicola sp.]